MGRSKAGLFLNRLITAATPVFEHVVAVERPGGEPRSIRTIFESPHDREAPLFGVKTALEDSRGRCFIVATDFPLITTEVLDYLRSRYERSNASMLVPVWAGIPQVLCAGYARCVLPALEQRIASGTLDLLGLLDDADVELVDESDLRARFGGEPLLNVNTPADLALAETYL